MTQSVKGRVHSKNFKKNIFIICMLAYPLIQFAIFWIGTNAGAILLTFQKYDWLNGRQWVLFDNYAEALRKMFFDDMTQRAIINSLWYMPVTCFISLPLSILFSYFLHKKMPLSGMYRVIFFLPSIIPVVVLAMSFTFVFDSSIGPVDYFLRKVMGIDTPVWFRDYPLSQIMIFIYCIWAGLGYNIILLSGAISRLPQDILEYNNLEGVGMARELFSVIIPLVWPTITTTFLLGCTSVFTVMLQPMLLTGNDPNSRTISLLIYNNVGGDFAGEYTAFGLLLSLVGVPIIMLIRWGLGKLFADIDF